MMKWKEALFGGWLAALGCSEPRDLGANSGWVDVPEEAAEPGAPETIYENAQEHIFGLTLEGETVYALVEHNGGFQLVSCPVERCRSERRVLYEGSKLAGEGRLELTLVHAGGFLAWSVTHPYLAGIALCPVTGCEELTFIEARGNVGIDGLAGDEEALYWTEGTALWSLEWGQSTPHLVRELPSFIVGALVSHDEFLYYASRGVERVHKSGDAEPELLAEDAQIHGLTAGVDALFYTTETLAGRIVRCPWSAASCDVSSLVSGQRYPSTVAQGADQLYWVTFPGLGALTARGAISSCSLPDCVDTEARVLDLPSPIGPRGDATVPLVAGSRSLMWLEDITGKDGSSESGSALRRLVR